MKADRACRGVDAAIDHLFLQRRGLFGRLWRGWVCHSVLDYRQSGLRHGDELLGLADEVGFWGPIGGRIPAAPAPSWVMAADRCRRLADADRVLVRRLAAAPGDPWARTLLGWTRPELRAGSLTLGRDAQAGFRAALDAGLGSPWTHLGLALAHESHRDWSEGLKEAARVVALRPRWPWGYAVRGLIYWQFAQLPESIADLERAVALDPGFDLAHLLLGRAKISPLFGTRDDISSLERAVALRPACGVYLAWKGYAHFLMGRPKPAYEDLTRAVGKTPLFDRAHAWRGTLLSAEGRPLEACADLERGALLNPDYAHARYSLSRARLDLGDHAAALASLKEACRIDREERWHRNAYNLGHSYPGAYARTLEDLGRLLAHYPDEAWLWAWQGQTLLNAKEAFDALPSLDRALLLDPRDPWARWWRAEALRRLGRCRQAMEDYDVALEALPLAAYARAGRGYCRLYLGDADDAVADLDKALSLDGRCGCGEAHAWRAEAFWRLGRRSRASRDLRAALNLYPNWDWAKRWLQDLDRGAPRPASSQGLRGAPRPVPDPARRRSILDARLRARPFDRPAFVLRSWLSLQLGDAASALRDASRALEMNMDPTDLEALRARAEAERALGSPAAAADNLRRIRALQPVGKSGPAAVGQKRRVGVEA